MEYLFVLASAIFVVGFSIIFQGIMNSVEQEGVSASLQKLQTKLFIRVAILEAVPIIMIIFTFIHLNGQTVEPLIPAILIVLIFLLGLFKVYVSFRDVNESLEDKDFQKSVQTSLFIAIPLLGAIPLISIIFLIILGA